MNKLLIAMGIAGLAGLGPVAAWGQQPPAPAPAPAAPPSTAAKPGEGASTSIISPTEGARIRGPFVVRFGLKGMG